MAKKLSLRRNQSVKRAELVDKPLTKRSRVGKSMSRGWQAAWQPTKRFLSKSWQPPTPKGRAGKVLGKRIRPPKYFREAWTEVKKVQWPNRAESIRLTTAVFMFAIVLALFTALADFGFSRAVQKLLVK